MLPEDGDGAEDGFPEIRADANSISDQLKYADGAPTAEIFSRIEQLELRIDQSMELGANTDEAVLQLKSYIASCEDDLVAARETRKIAAFVLIGVSLSLLALFMCFFAFRPELLKEYDPSVIVGFFVASVGGAVTLLIALARSASRSFEERNPSLPMATQLNEIIALIRTDHKA